MTENLPEGWSRSDYRGMINYEGILATHVTNIMRYRDNDMKLYCSAIETFILWCPHEIRDKGLLKLKELGLRRGHYIHVTDERRVLYDDLIIYINGLLQKENIIFRTGSFEIGHD